MVRAPQYSRKSGKVVKPNPIRPEQPKLKEGEADYNTPCTSCGATPTVHPTKLCGPCCFGDASTAGGNW